MSVVLGNKTWVLGGVGLTGFLNDVWYSADGVGWTLATAAAGWAARGWHTTVEFGERMWVLGGAAIGNQNDVWYSSGLAGIEEGQDWPAVGPCGALRITPNPVAGGVTTVRIQGFKESRNQGADVSVFDAAGRCVLVRSFDVRNSSFGLPLDLRALSSGVYLVRLDADGYTASQKLVVQR